MVLSKTTVTIVLPTLNAETPPQRDAFAASSTHIGDGRYYQALVATQERTDSEIKRIIKAYGDQGQLVETIEEIFSFAGIMPEAHAARVDSRAEIAAAHLAELEEARITALEILREREQIEATGANAAERGTSTTYGPITTAITASSITVIATGPDPDLDQLPDSAAIIYCAHLIIITLPADCEGCYHFGPNKVVNFAGQQFTTAADEQMDLILHEGTAVPQFKKI